MSSLLSNSAGLFSDAVAPPEVFENAGENFAAVVIFSLAAFFIFALALAIPLLRGKKLKHKCACSASREAMRILEERERAKRAAANYDRADVDAQNLPLASPELAEYARTR